MRRWSFTDTSMRAVCSTFDLMFQDGLSLVSLAILLLVLLRIRTDRYTAKSMQLVGCTFQTHSHNCSLRESSWGRSQI